MATRRRRRRLETMNGDGVARCDDAGRQRHPLPARAPPSLDDVQRNVWLDGSSSSLSLPPSLSLRALSSQWHSGSDGGSDAHRAISLSLRALSSQWHRGSDGDSDAHRAIPLLPFLPFVFPLSVSPSLIFSFYFFLLRVWVTRVTATVFGERVRECIV
ncbi:uncharacterized protein DS421_15g512050 [Arachis hypogaea]|nr:uncharacterized protein DS421_15g512050 [Arachis hypogaea]